MSSVAVVIPAYNRPGYLREALASVAAQTQPAAQVIVVDDGSTEDLASVCAGFAGVTYIRQDNQGVSAARNCGIEAVTSDFIVFLDNDDRLHPHALATGLAAFGDDAGIGFVFGRAQPVDTSGDPVDWELPMQPAVADYASLLAGRHIIAPAAFMVRTAAVRAVKGFQRHMYAAEECDLWRRIARDWRIVFHARVIFDYRIHQGNTSSNAPRMLHGALQMHDSHWSFVQASGRADWVAAFHEGRRFWIHLYGPDLVPQAVRRLRAGQMADAMAAFKLATEHYPRGYLEYPIDRARWLVGAIRRRLVPRLPLSSGTGR
jgi:glycosyltransferase involved in cell wall biosynthesis